MNEVLTAVDIVKLINTLGSTGVMGFIIYWFWQDRQTSRKDTEELRKLYNDKVSSYSDKTEKILTQVIEALTKSTTVIGQNSELIEELIQHRKIAPLAQTKEGGR